MVWEKFSVREKSINFILSQEKLIFEEKSGKIWYRWRKHLGHCDLNDWYSFIMKNENSLKTYLSLWTRRKELAVSSWFMEAATRSDIFCLFVREILHIFLCYFYWWKVREKWGNFEHVSWHPFLINFYLFFVVVLEFSQGMILPSKDSPVLQRSSSEALKATVVNTPAGSGDGNKNKCEWLDMITACRNKLLKMTCTE